MIFVYPNYFCLPVLKEENNERSIYSALLRADDEYLDDDIDIFKKTDEEYIHKTLKN